MSRNPARNHPIVQSVTSRMAVWFLVLLTSGAPLLAQGDLPESGIEYPLMVFNIASVNRLQEKADALFLAANRPEMSDVAQNWIDTTLRGMKGLDRDKPMGMMTYIKPGLTPSLTAVTYMPVADLDELLTLLAGTSGVVREVSSETQTYEITDLDWGPDLAVKQVGDYIFALPLEDQIELDRRFPNPERLVSRVTNRYDLSYSLLLKNVPPATKTIFLEFFKNQALAGLQQRDNEPDAAYRIRRANGESVIDLLDMVVLQGEELTIGGFANVEDETGYGELELSGSRDSGLAKFFQDLAGRRSYFENALASDSTFTFSTSIQLDEKRRKPLVELFSLAPNMVRNGLKDFGIPEETAAPSDGFFQSLQKTAEDGHLDFFVQMSGNEPLDYRFVGGVRILGAGDFSQQLSDLLTFGKETAGKLGASGPGGVIEKLDINSVTLAGYPLHVVPLPAPGDPTGLALFGPNPNLYLCATPQAFWFAVGQESARDQLQASMESLTAIPDAAAPRRTSAPLFFTTHAAQWVTIQLAGSAGIDPSGDLMALSEIFDEDNDEWRTTGLPTDNGFRIRTEVQSGYFVWLGSMISKQIDSELTQTERRAERRRRREATPVDAVPQK